MSIVSHIESFYTSSWVSAILLLLLLCLWGILWARPQSVGLGFSMSVSMLERRYNDNPHILSWLLSLLFSASVTALALYMLYYEGGMFRPIALFKLMLLVILTKFVIDALMWLTGYVFSFLSEVHIGSEQRSLIWLAVSVVVFALVVVAACRPMPILLKTGLALVAGLYELAIGVKLFRVFFFKPLSALYITLYWLTVELLPLVALWQTAGYIMKG